MTCSTVADVEMRRAISLRATRIPSGVVSTWASSCRGATSTFTTESSAVAPASPVSPPGPWFTTTLAAEAFPAASDALTPIVFEPAPRATWQEKPSPLSTAAWPLQVTPAIPEPVSRAVP